MAIDATFWVAVSFFIFVIVLVYFKIPQKVNNVLFDMDQGNVQEFNLTVTDDCTSESFDQPVAISLINPLPPQVSIATREFGSPCKYRSNSVSEILSHILSGCMGDTHSAVFII